MAVDATTATQVIPRDGTSPGYRINPDSGHVENDGFLDDFSFYDLLDVVNPLQHIPLVSTIYREITGDEIKSGPRIAGGFLFGGVLGAVGSLVNVAVDKMTGKDIGEHVVSLVKNAVGIDDEVVAQAQVDQPSGKASETAALTGDPNAPISLLPARWQPTGGGGAAPTGGAFATAATQGTAPVNPPLGHDALAPSNMPSATPGTAPPGRVEMVLPGERAALQGRAIGPVPQSLPLGYDAMTPTGTQTPAAGPTSATASATAAADPRSELARNLSGIQAAPQVVPTSLTQQEGLTREFAGKSLRDYQSNPGRAAVRSPARRGEATVETAGSQPDPAMMARLLEAQSQPAALSGGAQAALDTSNEATRVGDVLSVPQAGTGAASAPADPMGAGDEATAPQGWFNKQMMMGLEKYQRARGAVPVQGGSAIDA